MPHICSYISHTYIYINIRKKMNKHFWLCFTDFHWRMQSIWIAGWTIWIAGQVSFCQKMLFYVPITLNKPVSKKTQPKAAWCQEAFRLCSENTSLFVSFVTPWEDRIRREYFTSNTWIIQIPKLILNLK